MQLENVRYITVIFPLVQLIYLNHITTSSSICKCGKFSISVFRRTEYYSYQEAALLRVYAHFRWHLCISVDKGAMLILHNLELYIMAQNYVELGL